MLWRLSWAWHRVARIPLSSEKNAAGIGKVRGVTESRVAPAGTSLREREGGA